VFFYLERSQKVEKIKRPEKNKTQVQLMDNKNLQEYIENQLKNLYDKLDEIVECINKYNL